MIAALPGTRAHLPSTEFDNTFVGNGEDGSCCFKIVLTILWFWVESTTWNKAYLQIISNFMGIAEIGSPQKGTERAILYLMSQKGNGKVACSRPLPGARYTLPFHSLSET